MLQFHPILIQKGKVQRIAALLIKQLIKEERKQLRIPEVKEMRTVSQIKFREN
jgi:hypothetical protein